MPCIDCGGWTDGTGETHPECKKPTIDSKLVIHPDGRLHNPGCKRDIDCKACHAATLALYEVAWQSAEDRIIRILNERKWSGESLDDDIANITRLILEQGT